MVADFPEKNMTGVVVAEGVGATPVIIRKSFSKLNTAGLLETKSGRGKTAVNAVKAAFSKVTL